MKGANEFASIFKTGQYGRMYFVSGRHARGKTFRIFILPAEAKGKPNGDNNAPLNHDAVEVYGVIGGVPGWNEEYGWLLPGWNEEYGWLYDGQWQNAFYAIVVKRKEELAEAKRKDKEAKMEAEAERKKRINELLSAYK